MLEVWLRRVRFVGTSLLCLLGLAPPAPGADSTLEPAGASDAATSEGWLAPLGPTALVASTRAETPRRLWLGVGAGVAATPGERERVFAQVELGLGLDTWLGEREAATPAGDLEPDRREGDALAPDALAPDAPMSGALMPNMPGPASPLVASLGAQPSAIWAALGPAGSAVPAPPPPGPRHQPRCLDARTCDPASAAVLARAVVAEVLRVHGSARELSRLDGMVSRSRAAASLPEVRLGAGTSRDESLRQNPTLADPSRYSRDGGRDLWLEARLTWRLDSAIFASDEIAIMRLRAQQREDTARLARDVLEALIDWQRARLLLDGEAVLPEERDAAALRQFGAVARLDVLSDGWFSRYLARASRSVGESPGPDACGSAGGGLQGPHGFRDSAGTIGPQKARRCAKGASLTSLNLNAKLKSSIS